MWCLFSIICPCETLTVGKPPADCRKKHPDQMGPNKLPGRHEIRHTQHRHEVNRVRNKKRQQRHLGEAGFQCTEIAH